MNAWRRAGDFRANSGEKVVSGATIAQCPVAPPTFLWILPGVCSIIRRVFTPDLTTTQQYEDTPAMGSIKKKRRAKMSKHKHDKRIKLERHKTR